MATDSTARAASAPIAQMLDALGEGYSVALTADVPKVARVAGPGIVRLARDSGRPIYPVALASSRRVEFDNWDRSVMNLPFSRLVGVVGEPIRVPETTDDTALGSRAARGRGLAERRHRARLRHRRRTRIISWLQPSDCR